MTDLLDPPDTAAGDARRRRTRIVLIGVLVAVIALGAAVWWFFFRDDSPEAFDIDDAVGAVTDDDTPTEPTDDAGDPSDDAGAETEAFDGDVEGTWVIDPTAGADAGGPTAGFRVAEELASVGATEAVGRTTEVTGSLTIAGTQVTAADFVVDMASLATDDSRRDGRMRSALEVDEFPTAQFVLTQPIELGEVPAPGETVSFTAVGDMTIHGVTNPVEIALDAQVTEDGVLVVVGSLNVLFADYGVQAPSAAIVVSIEDNATVEFQLFLTPDA